MLHTIAGKTPCSPQQNSGYTLIELIASMAIAAIVASLAAPQVGRWLDRAEQAQIRASLTQFLTAAKQEAITRNQRVVFCHVDTSNQCNDSWAPPLTAFVDADEDGEMDSLNDVILVWNIKQRHASRLRWSRNSSFSFFIANAGRSPLTGTFSYCHPRQPDLHFGLVLSRTGRLRLDREGQKCN